MSLKGTTSYKDITRAKTYEDEAPMNVLPSFIYNQKYLVAAAAAIGGLWYLYPSLPRGPSSDNLPNDCDDDLGGGGDGGGGDDDPGDGDGNEDPGEDGGGDVDPDSDFDDDQYIIISRVVEAKSVLSVELLYASMALENMSYLGLMIVIIGINLNQTSLAKAEIESGLGLTEANSNLIPFLAAMAGSSIASLANLEYDEQLLLI